MLALRFPASGYVIDCVDGGRIDLPSEYRISRTPWHMLTQRCDGSFRIRHPGRRRDLRTAAHGARSRVPPAPADYGALLAGGGVTDGSMVDRT